MKKPIDSVTAQAINLAIAKRINFIAYAYPGEDKLRFECDCQRFEPDSDVPMGSFALYPFAGKRGWIPQSFIYFGALEFIGYSDSLEDGPDEANMHCARVSTTRREHLDAVAEVVDTLKRDGGKVVVSQLTAVTSRKPIVDVLNDYFGQFPDTFRYVCRTEETGLWFGATPELLLDSYVDDDDHPMHTMALAGTRPADATGEWDEKNLREHKFVVDYIRQKFDYEDKDGRFFIEPQCEVIFGKIKHLCTPITVDCTTPNPFDVMVDLHPTPAVAGYPVDRAMELIKRVEKHDRLNYAGFVSVAWNGRFRAYVNLRCAMAEPLAGGEWLYNVMSGGGIVADSDPESEWEEARAKCAPLLDAIGGTIL